MVKDIHIHLFIELENCIGDKNLNFENGRDCVRPSVHPVSLSVVLSHLLSLVTFLR